MVPYVASQIQAIIEGIRLLESFVTAPLGLHSDIKMMRESLPFPEAAALPREKLQEMRTAFAALTDSPLDLALGSISTISATLDTLEATKGDGGSPLSESWVAQARRVLTRVEQKVGADMRARVASKIRGLYVIVDPDVTNGRPVLEVAEASLKGGASVIQLRDKSSDKSKVLSTARALKEMCDGHSALLVANDDADVALVSGAHGLHIGQTDLPVAEARRVLAPHQLLGRSNNTVDEAMDSQGQGVDYLAVGAVYATSTVGKGTRPAVGVEMVSRIKGMVAQPVVAIGGINADNVSEVVGAGADCVCVVSAVTLAGDPEAAARWLVEAIEGAR